VDAAAAAALKPHLRMTVLPKTAANVIIDVL